MKTPILLSALLSLAAMTSHAQTTKQKLDQIKKDPETAERAAKADVHVVKKQPHIADSASQSSKAATKVIATEQKRKKKSHKKSGS